MRQSKSGIALHLFYLPFTDAQLALCFRSRHPSVTRVSGSSLAPRFKNLRSLKSLWTKKAAQELCTRGCSDFVASFNVAEFFCLFVCFFFLILSSFCSKEPSLTVGEVTYGLFDRVLVKINVDKSSTENKFLSFSIISKKVLIEDRDRILFHSILKDFNINPKLQTTLDAMFTLWYRILRSFSCHSMNRI